MQFENLIPALYNSITMSNLYLTLLYLTYLMHVISNIRATLRNDPVHEHMHGVSFDNVKLVSSTTLDCKPAHVLINLCRSSAKLCQVKFGSLQISRCNNQYI